MERRAAGQQQNLENNTASQQTEFQEYCDHHRFRKILSSAGESHVLIISTGGTIACKEQNGIYVTKKNYIGEVVRNSPVLNDKTYAASTGLPFENGCGFVLPKLQQHEKRVVYYLLEYSVLIESSSVQIDDYKRIAKDVKDNYEHFDGFVILHGTDTMAYTASYLSFMFENLGKPVVLTGAQIPLSETRSDGIDNILGSLLVAGNYRIPEVTIFFHHKLYRGNRSVKADNGSFQAFDSLRCDPLVAMEIEVKVNWGHVRQETPRTPGLSIKTELERNVAILRLFPGITSKMVRGFLDSPTSGLVLLTYGIGNLPESQKDIMKLFREALERGVLIVNCTQCYRGSVFPVNVAVSDETFDYGIVPGYDMTPEAALAKLSYLLGRKDLTQKDRVKLLQENMRGEITTVEPKSQVCKSANFLRL